MTVPTAEAQIDFLQSIQRLFEEGEFQATYKYALLLSLAELAVERGDDSGQALDLGLTEIAEKFAELYWRQVVPYQSGAAAAEAGVIAQNRGSQAAVIPPLAALHRQSGGQWSRARHLPAWQDSLRAIASVIRNMPLRYLQILGGQPVPFLYDYPISRGIVRLKPGVAFNLRRYQALIQQLARAGWVDHVRGNRLNASLLGSQDDLEAFMFGSSRASLGQVVPILQEIQVGRCFYCQGSLRGTPEVDHFIPWTRYPRDTAHNFVLSHRSCNNDKRALLAATPHLTHWLERNERHGGTLGAELASLGFVADAGCSRQVARWAYEQAVSVQAQVWAGKGRIVPVTSDCLTLFG